MASRQQQQQQRRQQQQGAGAAEEELFDEDDEDASYDEDDAEDAYGDEEEDGDLLDANGQVVPLPCVLLEARGTVHALFAPAPPPGTAEVLVPGSVRHYTTPILGLIAFLKAHFHVVTDVAVVFPDLELEFHQDSVHTRVHPVAQLVDLHSALLRSRDANLATPLRAAFVEHTTNFYARWKYLESLQQKGSIPQDPIVLDSDDDDDDEQPEDSGKATGRPAGAVVGQRRPHDEVAAGTGDAGDSDGSTEDGNDDESRKRANVEA